MKAAVLRFWPMAVLVSCFPTHLQAGDGALGKAKSASCAGCHGINGISSSQEYPNLAGQKEKYLLKQLKNFKSGARKEPTMNAMSASLSEADMANLAAYYASFGSKPVAQTTAAPKPASGRVSKQEFPEPVFMSQKKDGNVRQFPSNQVWGGGPNMLYTAVTPDGRTLLSTSPSSNSVYVFDTASGKYTSVVKVGKAPKGVKITPDGKLAYVSNEGEGSISVVNLASLKVVDTIATEEAPHNVRFTRDGKTAYVTLQGGAGIGVIDTAKRKVARIIPVPGITGPHNIDLSKDEKTAFVRDFVHNVAVLDLNSGKVKKVIEVGNGHGGIDVSPNGRYVVTAAIGDDYVSVIDTRTLKTKNIKVGNGPHGVRASKDSRWIYVTVTKDNTAVVIDSDSMKVTSTISAGNFPFWVAVQGNP